MSLTTAGAAGVGTHEKGYNRKKRRVGVSGTREGGGTQPPLFLAASNSVLTIRTVA